MCTNCVMVYITDPERSHYGVSSIILHVLWFILQPQKDLIMVLAQSFYMLETSVDHERAAGPRV